MKRMLQVAFVATFVLLASVVAHSNRAAAQGAGDAAITAAVKTQLASHGETKVSNINVSTAQGVVSLSGTARSLAAKDEAQRVSTKVPGVKSVRNSLEIVEVPDATILAEIKDSFSSHHIGSAAQVTTASSQGVVTLSGTATSPAAKDEVGDLAKRAEGVKSVVNNIVARQ